MNKIILVGRVAKELEIRETKEGLKVGTMLLVVDRKLNKEKRLEMEERGEKTADFFNVTVWRNQAESCEKFLKKGSSVSVEGFLRNNAYEASDGTRRSTNDIIAEKVQFISNIKTKEEIEE